MSRVTHNALHNFTAGINSANSARPNSLPFLHPVQQGWKVLCEDYNGQLVYTADSALHQFTAIGSGTTAAGTGGVLFDNGSNADNEGAHLMSIGANIIPSASTKKFYLETQMTATAATMAGSEIYVGLSSLQGTTIGDFVASGGDSWTMDDGFGIGKLDTETAMSFIANQSDVEQTVSFGSNPTTAVSQVWAVYYDGTNYKLYLDGTEVADTPKVVFNNDAPMTFVSYLRAGTAELQNLLVNYILFAYEI